MAKSKTSKSKGAKVCKRTGKAASKAAAKRTAKRAVKDVSKAAAERTGKKASTSKRAGARTRTAKKAAGITPIEACREVAAGLSATYPDLAADKNSPLNWAIKVLESAARNAKE